MKFIKWIIGYVDCFGAINTHIVRVGDAIDSHLQRWPGRVSSHGKFRWSPERPFHLTTYGQELTEEEFENIINKILEIEKREPIRERR